MSGNLATNYVGFAAGVSGGLVCAALFILMGFLAALKKKSVTTVMVIGGIMTLLMGAMVVDAFWLYALDHGAHNAFGWTVAFMAIGFILGGLQYLAVMDYHLDIL